MKIYVGCALNDAPENFKNAVADLKEQLEERGHAILHFRGQQTTDVREVYQQDIHTCVQECDIMLAICDFPSLGLGYELATMVEKHGKPVLAVAHQDTSISMLIRGIDHSHFTFRQYADFADIEEILEEKMQGISS